MLKYLLLSKMKFLLLIILTIVTFQNINAQGEIYCKVDGDDFIGKVESAALVTIGSENFIQVKAVEGEKMMFVYLKTTKLGDPTPVTLEYRDRDSVNTLPPDAELVWAPDGPERPQWNSVEGKTVVNQYDSTAKTISGTFEFVVEKFSYSSRANANRPKAEIEEGKFSNIKYIIEETK